MVKILLFSHDIVINEPQFSRLLSSEVEAIIEMLKPQDVAGVRRFIGFVNYLNKLMPRLSEVCEPLRCVAMKDVDGTGQNIKTKLSKN